MKSAANRAPEIEENKPLKIPPIMLARSRHRGTKLNAFKLPEVPPGVLPKKMPKLAQDAAAQDIFSWAASDAIYSSYAEGVAFLGFPYLAALSQRAEYRVASEEIAAEMTREWIELKSTGDDDKSDKIKALEAALKKYKVREAFRQAALYDGQLGRGHIYIDTGATDTPDELQQPIGDGRDAVSKAKVGKKKLIALRPVEGTWCYPAQYESSNPLKPDWYKPTHWYVNGLSVHSSRLLTFVGRPVLDILKPAYAFAGLSMSQMMKPYVDNWLNTRQAVADLIKKFSVSGIYTPFAATMGPDGQAVFDRIETLNNLRDNNGALVLNKDTEEWFNISTPLGGLHELQSQAQEHQAAVTRIPGVKLFGIQPQGFNASSEGEIRSYYDWVAAYQEFLFGDNLTAVLGFIQLSEFGEVDPDITYEFKPLWQMDEAGEAAIQKTKADTDDAYVAMGAVGPSEVRQRVAKDPKSPYHGLDLDGPAPGIPGEGETDETGEVDATGETKPNGLIKPRDPGNSLASSITTKAAKFGGASMDMAADGKLDRSVFLYVPVSPDENERCGLCEHYSAGCELYRRMNRDEPDIYDLDSDVDPDGRCNAFQPKSEE